MSMYLDLDDVVADNPLAKKELATLRTVADNLAKAGSILFLNLPEDEIELAREVWGNTNTRIILDARKELGKVIAAYNAQKG